VVLALGAFAAVACTEAPAGGLPRVGDMLPEFAAPILDGDTVALASYRGEPVLVNLWATWCAPCREEMPYLEAIGREYAAAGLRVVGISSDTRGALAQVRHVVAERGVTYDVLLDPRARSTDLFGAFGLPVTFLADADGRITWMRLGPIAEGDPDFVAALDAVTGRSGS
jgi:peroxiredoxin